MGKKKKQQKRLGPSHPSTALGYNNIAFVHSQRKEHDQAIAYLLKSQAIYLERMGSDHCRVAESCTNIAIAYAFSGGLDQARYYLGKAVKIYVGLGDDVKINEVFNIIDSTYDGVTFAQE